MPKRQKTKENYQLSSSEPECDERYFLNPESVSQHLFCSICQEVYVNPYRAPCGHSFCKRCILPWLNQSKTCPEDRKPVHPKDLHHDFILENIIGDQMVTCPFRKHGCDFIGHLAMLSSHLKNCDFNLSNLPEFLKTHLVDSPFAKGPLKEKTNTPLSEDEEADDLPTPVKPSLKMRLFRAGGGSRQLLCSMFDKDSPGSS
ncbi:RING finger protein 151-like [Lingula anatina]|uniref:RING finger protein 151-like n=1 Tax=Lingula anatina TaxID=7574 RepID=A0A1S3HQF4_LINAN|nr:RING finger protein 151-like [Lingula anatina]|eukprot:XP_013387269.1 RING finger protein 151-like [Lingula anatina]